MLTSAAVLADGFAIKYLGLELDRSGILLTIAILPCYAQPGIFISSLRIISNSLPMTLIKKKIACSIENIPGVKNIITFIYGRSMA